MNRRSPQGFRIIPSEGLAADHGGARRKRRNERIERPETTDGVRAGLRYGYGLGNLMYPGAKGIFFGHDGGIDGFVSKYEYAPGLGVGFVVMANLGTIEVLKAGDDF